MRLILVDEVYQLTESASPCVPESSTLEEVAKLFARDNVVRAVFLVDEQQRFSGMMRRADLLKWVHLYLYGKTGGGAASTGEVLRLTFAKHASDLARGDANTLGVRPQDTLESAMNKMMINAETVLPVLDDDNKVLGDLRATDLLKVAFAIVKKAES